MAYRLPQGGLATADTLVTNTVLLLARMFMFVLPLLKMRIPLQRVGPRSPSIMTSFMVLSPNPMMVMVALLILTQGRPRPP